MSYLRELDAARVVVYNPSEDIVLLRPGAVVLRSAAAADCEGATASPLVSDTAASDAVQYRRRFWSAVGVASGAQMAGMSYLTFQAFDWDTMEPASYFLGSVTSIVFYAYFVLYRREHSLTDVDKTLLPKRFAPPRK